MDPDNRQGSRSFCLAGRAGFNLPWWDRLFGTYRDQPAAGHEAMAIGIEQFRDPAELRLDRMLLQPLRGGSGPYPLGHEKRG